MASDKRTSVGADSTEIRFCELAGRLLDLPGPHPIIAIDGPGGAGKSTFADRLVASTEAETSLLHTDAFARPDEPTAWWPRLQAVIERLADGQQVAFDPYDWTRGCLGQPQTVSPTALIIIEGVSSSRSEWLEHLSFSIWIDASSDLCRERGVHRDGVTPLEWDQAATAEEAFFLRDGARGRANLVVDSATSRKGLDPEVGFMVRT